MSPDPLHTPNSASAERQQAVWPWLLLPLVMLALFFALRTVKPAPVSQAAQPEAAVTQPGQVSESR